MNLKFDDFLNKYEQLVNLSPTLNWSDFEDSKPTFESKGFQKSSLLKQKNLHQHPWIGQLMEFIITFECNSFRRFWCN